jgi:hypothetical protein
MRAATRGIPAIVAAAIFAGAPAALPDRAEAFTIAAEGFSYTAGTNLDGQGSGFGWDTGPFVNGQMTGGCGAAVPDVYGHSGGAWVTSSSYGSGSHNKIASGSLAYPGMTSSGNMLVEVDGSLHSGNSGLRAFRTVRTSATGLAPWVNGGFFGRGTLFFAFLARIDSSTCGGSTPCSAPPCDQAGNLHDAGIHLFQGFGDLATCSDGPKHPYEHLFLVDQNRTNVWSAARTTGGGTGAWTGITGLTVDSTTRLYLVEVDFDTNHACAATGANLNVCPPSGTTATNCGGATTGNETLTVWIDPDLSAPIDLTKAPAAKIGPVSIYDFAFDTIEVGGEGETLDIDELRLGTRVDDVIADHPYCASNIDCASDPQGHTLCDSSPGISTCVAPGGATTTTTTTTTTTLVNATTSTTTSTTTTTTPATDCTPDPRSDCLSAEPSGAKLAIAADADATRDSLKLQWRAADAVALSDFGDPASTTGYAICLYDALGLGASDDAPAGRSCGGRPCWRASTSTIHYKDPSTTPDGIRKMTLVAGNAGRARIDLTGRGANLRLPPLPLTAPFEVQLQRSDGGQCYSAAFSAAPVCDGMTRCKAVSD